MVAGIFVGLQVSMQNIERANQQEVMQQVAGYVANEVQLARQVGEGYNRTFRMPLYLGGDPYNVSVKDDFDLVIDYKQGRHVEFFPEPVNGKLVKGDNVVTYDDGNVTITPG